VDSPLLILGGSGQLGGAVLEALGEKAVRAEEFLESGGPAGAGNSPARVDVTDLEALREVLGKAGLKAVINCAAYTKVDQAEEEEERAEQINVQGAANVAQAAKEVGARVLHLSTDFVFDGAKGAPYTEADPPAPINAYGRTKWAGENAVRRENPDHLIIRTAWLFGPHGSNFVRTIIRLSRKTNELNVVDDQVGSPTFTLDLARALPRLLELDLTGTFHLVNQGQASWFALARKALKIIGLKVKLSPITSDRLGRKALRPAYSVLDCDRLSGLGVDLRPWEEALEECLHHPLWEA
jgi:dTDP-4-dehydrorhamnose reductase